MDRIRLMVVDDHPVVREGIKAMLSTDGEVEVMAEASSGVEAVRKVTELGPDVVLMDVRMPEMDGIETTRRVKEARPGVVVVMLSMYEHDAYVVEAVRAGAAGYLLKDASRELLLHTVKAARSGGTLVKSSLLRRALGGYTNGRQEVEPAKESGTAETAGRSASATEPIPLARCPPRGVTPREMEVLELVARGGTNKEIGQALHIAEVTVKKHVVSIMGKMGASNRSDAAVRAVRAGLVCRG